MSDDRLFHIALSSEWDGAEQSGTYDRSTLGASVGEVGFVHCSRGLEQALGVVDLFYAQVSEPIVLLHIDEAALPAAGLTVIAEHADRGDPTSAEFPHIYGGPLPVGTVAEVLPLTR